MWKNVVLVIFSALFLAGCAVPYPVQSGGFNVQYRDQNSSVSFGGNGSTTIGIMPMVNTAPQGVFCPPGSAWDGRGCRVFAPVMINNNPTCPRVYTPGFGWVRCQ